MRKRLDIQTFFILREFQRAVAMGAYRYAARIVRANPQIHASKFLDAMVEDL